MSDLQLALLVLGAIFIFAVMLFNWWQERKFKNEVAQRFTPNDDILMEDEFHFDADAILKEESPAHAEEKMTGFDEEGFVEDRRVIEDVYEEIISHNAPDEVGSHATALKAEEAQAATEFETVWEELEEELSDPARKTESSGTLTYEDHVWYTESISHPDDQPQEAATSAELSEEAGFDQPLKDQQGAHLDSGTTTAPDENIPDPLALSSDIDPHIDLIAVLYLPQMVTGDKLREFLITSTDIDKPKYLHGLGTDRVWRLMTREQESLNFTKATCALQLADRSGFVSRNALNRFQHEVDRLGLKLNAQVEWQVKGDPWQLASELDQFCIDVDKMVGFHLIQGGNGPFTGTKFRGLAEANGLVLGNDGAFHSENEGHRQFSVVNRDNHPFSINMLRTSVIHGVSFQLDIPRVKNCAEIFNQMILTARQMETSLGAMLVDDNQRPIGDTQIEKIRQQLKVIHAKMVARGIVPGSPSALRLFS